MPRKGNEVPVDQLLQLRMQPRLKAKLIQLGQQNSEPASEVAVRAICRGLDLDEEFGVLPRLPPGRKPNPVTVKKRKGQ